MNKLRVTFLVSYSHDGVTYEPDDSRSFDYNVGVMFCEAGVAKDQSGNVKTAKIDPTKNVRIKPDSMSQTPEQRTK